MTDLSKIPIIRQAVFFLQEAGSSSGIKITETGALGRNFVQTLWDKHLKKSDDDLVFRPTRELECPEATRIHFLLSDCKYVRKFKGKICLTEKGEQALETQSLETQSFERLYFDLITAAINEWNWGFEDRYPDYEFIQRSATALVESIFSFSASTITAEQLFDTFFAKKIKNIDENLKNELQRCLMIRFFYRFCIPFGLLKSEEWDHFLSKKTNDPFEKTEFLISDFKRIISENIHKQSKIKNEKLNPSSGFTLAAKKFWDDLDQNLRVKLINNAFCCTCRAQTGIGDFSGSVVNGNLVLKGICTKCGGPVARLIESDWLN